MDRRAFIGAVTYGPAARRSPPAWPSARRPHGRRGSPPGRRCQHERSVGEHARSVASFLKVTQQRAAMHPSRLAWSWILALLLLSGCATRPINPPITQIDAEGGYTFQNRQKYFKN